MKRVYIALAVLVLGLAGALAFKLYQRAQAADAPAGGTGVIEGIELDVVPKLAARIRKILVEEGALVKAGAPLVELDCDETIALRDELAARVAAANAATNGARGQALAIFAQARGAKASARSSRASARMTRLAEGAARAQATAAAGLHRSAEAAARSAVAAEQAAAAQASAAEAERRVAEKNRARVSRLAERDVAPPAELDSVAGRAEALAHQVDAAKASIRVASARLGSARSSAEAAQAQVTAARAQTETTRAQGDAALAAAQAALAQSEGVSSQHAAAQAQVEVARKSADAARSALARAELQVGECTLRAPRDAMVLSRNHEVGELALPGTRLLTLVDLRDARLTFFLANADLAHAKPGSAVEVLADAYPGRTFEGRILSVAAKAEFTPRNVQTREDRDRLSYAVKVAVPNPSLELRAGMPVEVRIPGTRRGRP